MNKLGFEVGDEVLEAPGGKVGIITGVKPDGRYKIRLHGYPYTIDNDYHSRLPQNMKHTKKSILKKFFNGL